jgi:[ribosomal protein S5]-alanine N-acetyltransferase
MNLRTSRLVLTPLAYADLDDLVRMYLDTQTMATLGGTRTPDQTAQYLQTHLDHWDEHGFGFWAARDLATGQFAGRGGLRRLLVEGTPVIEVGYGFLPEYWGRGLATELARESVRVAFEELHMPTLACFTLPTNLASRRVMEKVGFQYQRDFIFADLPHILFKLDRPQGVTLRHVAEADLPLLFEHQNDPVACDVAKFPSRSHDAFMSHWHEKVLGNPTGIVRTVLLDSRVVGNIVSFSMEGRRLVGYWIGREHWGQGIATKALAVFLNIERQRPLSAFVAKTNVGSIRVLEKCGFQRAQAGESEDELLMEIM